MPEGIGGKEAWLPLARSGRAETSDGAGEARETRGGRECSEGREPDDSPRLGRGVLCDVPSSLLASLFPEAPTRTGGVLGGPDSSEAAGAGDVDAAGGAAAAVAVETAGVTRLPLGGSLAAGSFSPAFESTAGAAFSDSAALGLDALRFGTVASAAWGAFGALSSAFPERRDGPEPAEAVLCSADSAGFSPSPVTWKRTRPGMVIRVFTDSDEACTSLRELVAEVLDAVADCDEANGPLLPEDDDDEAALNSPDSAATSRPLRVEAWLARLGGIVPIDILAAGPPERGVSTALTASKPPVVRRCLWPSMISSTGRFSSSAGKRPAATAMASGVCAKRLRIGAPVSATASTSAISASIDE